METIKSTNSLVSKIELLLIPKVEELGYELLDVEYLPNTNVGGPVLRLFIENPKGLPVGFEDCTTVDHGLDPVFESLEFDQLLPKGFTLEVSSPGVDRPLKKTSDFERYKGKYAMIKTYRALTLEDLGNAKYFEHHQKQKNFSGILLGYEKEAVLLEVDKEKIRIPFALIAKANLDAARFLDSSGA